MTIPENYQSGDWKILYAEGGVANMSTGKSFNLQLSGEVKHETIISLLNLIAGESFERVEYHTDGKFYLYRSGDNAPIVRDLTHKGEQTTTHTALLKIYQSKPGFPSEMVECAERLSKIGLQETIKTLTALTKTLPGLSSENAIDALDEAIDPLKEFFEDNKADRQIFDLLWFSLDGELNYIWNKQISEDKKAGALKSIITHITRLNQLLRQLDAGTEVTKLPSQNQITAFVDSLPIDHLLRLHPKIIKMKQGLIKKLELAKSRLQTYEPQDNKESMQTNLKDILDDYTAPNLHVKSEEHLDTTSPLVWPLNLLFALENPHESVGNCLKALEAHIKQIEALEQELELRQTAYVNAHAGAIVKSSTDLVQALSATTEPKKVAALHIELRKATNDLLIKAATRMAFEARGLAASYLVIPPNHPLIPMNQKIREQTAKSPSSAWGAFFSGFNTKGGYLHAAGKNIEGTMRNCFDFRVSMKQRDEMQTTLNAILSDVTSFQESLPKGLCQGVKVDVKPQVFRKWEAGVFQEEGGLLMKTNAVEINFIGLGKVIIGNNPESLGLYNWINIELDPDLPDGEAILKLNQILTLLGMGPVLLHVDPEVDEKIKMASLARAFYPGLIAELDNNLGLADLSPDELKRVICEKEPKMVAIFQSHLPLMVEEEIFPGQKVWAVPSIAGLVRQKRGWGLMTGITNDKRISFNELCGYVVRWLKEGLMSSQNRFSAGWIRLGESSERDINCGGGDQVFLRLVTQALKNVSIEEYPLSGDIQVLFDLSILNRGGYAYDEDHFGTKVPGFYNTRKNFMDATAALRSVNSDNEVMIKGRVPPEYIIGVVVPTEKQKLDLIAVLTASGLIVDGKVLSRIPVDEFVHVQTKMHAFKKEYWDDNTPRI